MGFEYDTGQFLFYRNHSESNMQDIDRMLSRGNVRYDEIQN